MAVTQAAAAAGTEARVTEAVVYAPTAFATGGLEQRLLQFLTRSVPGVQYTAAVFTDDRARLGVDADDKDPELRFLKNLKNITGRPLLQKCAAPLLGLSLLGLGTRTRRAYGCAWNDFAVDPHDRVNRRTINQRAARAAAAAATAATIDAMQDVSQAALLDGHIELPQPLPPSENLCAAFVGDEGVAKSCILSPPPPFKRMWRCDEDDVEFFKKQRCEAGGEAAVSTARGP